VRLRLLISLLLAALLGALGAVWAIERELARTWLAVGVHPEVIEALGEAMRTERQLAEAAPERAAEARARFARLERLQNRLRVVALGQDQLVRRAQGTLLVTVLALLVAGGGLWWAARRHAERRLERLRGHLAALAAGATHLDTGERRDDALGRVAAMVEETARVVGRDRQQAAALAHLEQWQQAARRQVHELRTPLTAAVLEISRLRDLLIGTPPSWGDVASARLDALAAELERLRRFTAEFAGFARLREPRPEPTDLDALLAGLVRTFAGAWPGTTVRLAEEPARPGAGEARAAAGAPEAGALESLAWRDSGPTSPADRPRAATAARPVGQGSSEAAAARGRDGGEPGSGAGTVATVDRELTRQLVVNLLDNAGRAGAREVTLAVTRPGPGEVAIEVRDDGPGLPDTIRERLFQPYNTTRRSGEGLGLGLAIAKKIALDHRGDLELLATGPAGTTFRFRLPLAPRENP
jgi:signal transduction histidine kinase